MMFDREQASSQSVSPALGCGVEAGASYVQGQPRLHSIYFRILMLLSETILLTNNQTNTLLWGQPGFCKWFCDFRTLVF